MKTIKWIIILFTATQLQAQSKTGAYGLVDIGYAAPASVKCYIANVAAGVRLGRWGVGLATGKDWGGMRSTPVLLDARFTVLPGIHALDVFSQQGFNDVDRKKDHWGDQWGNGYYWRGGASWRLVKTKKFGGLYTSASARFLSYKRYVDIEYITDLFPGPAAIPDHNTLRVHEWGLDLSLGWRW